ncbi:MAG: universal stress protein [Actinomycetales bacterium]|nr:universal stress protein [Actinomycetales bacterium]
MARRYLVGVDGSAPSLAALDWALRRARQSSAPLVLVHVTEGADAPHEGPARSAEAGRALLDGELERVRALGVEVSATQPEGSLAWALGDLAEPDDVVVVGTHKTGYLHGRVLGSRSVQIALAVRASVVAVPEVDLRFRRGIVAGVDRLETAGEIGRAAAEEAQARGEELTLLEAVPNSAVRRDELPIARAAQEAARAAPGLVIRSRVSTRPPAEALLDAARDKALLVLGPGSLDATRSPIGSVLHDVLLNVTAPVLVVRPSGALVAAPAGEGAASWRAS